MFSYKDPGKAADPYLNQIEQQTQQSMQPYTSMSNIGPQLQQQYGQMAMNPVQNMEGIRSQYKQTPGHKRALYDAMMAANNAAASGGMIGTPLHQEQMMETAAAINDPYEREWTRDAMAQQRYGMQGQQGLFNQSMDANRYANETMGDINYTRGNLASRSAQQSNRRRNDILKFLLGAGGAVFGGPLGGIAGNSVGGALFGNDERLSNGDGVGNAIYRYFNKG